MWMNLRCVDRQTQPIWRKTETTANSRRQNCGCSDKSSSVCPTRLCGRSITLCELWYVLDSLLYVTSNGLKINVAQDGLLLSVCRIQDQTCQFQCWMLKRGNTKKSKWIKMKHAKELPYFDKHGAWLKTYMYTQSYTHTTVAVKWLVSVCRIWVSWCAVNLRWIAFY